MIMSLFNTCAQYISINNIEYNDEILPKECIALLNEIKRIILYEKELRKKRIDNAHFIYEKETNINILTLACINEDIETLENIMNKYKNLTENYFINYASYYGNLNIVKYLIIHRKIKLDPDTFIHICGYGFLSIVKFLVANTNDININYIDQYEYTALIYAAVNGHLDIVKFLVLECGAKGVGLSPLPTSSLGSYATQRRGSEIPLAQARNLANLENDKPMEQAGKRGHLEIVKFLADHGGNLGYALHWATFNNNLELVKYFINCGDAISLISECDYSMFRTAYSIKNYKILEYFIDNFEYALKAYTIYNKYYPYDTFYNNAEQMIWFFKKIISSEKYQKELYEYANNPDNKIIIEKLKIHDINIIKN